MEIFVRGFAILFYCFFIAGCAASSQEKAKDYKTYNENSPKMEAKASAEAPIKLEGQDSANAQNVAVQSTGAAQPQELLDSSMRSYKEANEYWKTGRLQEALDALDKAYVAIARIDTDTDRGFEKKKEDMRLKVSRLVQEIHASRCKTLNGSNCAIPLTLNDDVQRQINLLLGPERKWFINAYKRSGKFREDIAKEFKDAGLPEELSWLPLIESGFNTRALSKAHALGLWQIIPSTGCRFGLERTAWVDERMDPEKSTQAAITYLKDLHNMFGDWTTVLAAYNCGEGTVIKTIKEQKISYLDNFWDLYKRLPKESAAFVPRFLAVLEIVKNPQKYNLDLNEPDEPLPTEEVTLNKQIRLKSLAENLGVYYQELVELNPELRQDVTPNTEYRLKVPYGKADELLAKLDSIPEWSPPNTYIRSPHREKAKQRHTNHKKIRLKRKSKVAGHKTAHKSKGKIAVVPKSKMRGAASRRILALDKGKGKGHTAGLAVVRKFHKTVKILNKNTTVAKKNEPNGHGNKRISKYSKASKGNQKEKKASSHVRNNKGRSSKKDS